VHRLTPSALTLAFLLAALSSSVSSQAPRAAFDAFLEIPAQAPRRTEDDLQRSGVRIDRMYFETSHGRTPLPAALTSAVLAGDGVGEALMPDGRVVRLAVRRDGRHYACVRASGPSVA
jgi:hypothetical protein